MSTPAPAQLRLGRRVLKVSNLEKTLYPSAEFTKGDVIHYYLKRVRVQIKPYVEETEEGPVEMADLFFEDGSATRKVPFAQFRFVS